MNLEGRVAAVTGGGAGIGEAISLGLAAEGAKVAVLDVDLRAAELTATLAGGHPVRCDVSDVLMVDQAFAQIEREVGPIDILVNNAGIRAVKNLKRLAPNLDRQRAEAAAGRLLTPLDALSRLEDDEWHQMISVHLTGTFYCSRAAVRQMAPRGRGVIVNISSVCGVEGCTGHPHYSAAKAGILGFTRSVAKELALQGIRVNAIAPGYVEGPRPQAVANAVVDVPADTPLGRLGRPAEIAAAVVFLAGDDASYFVGDTLSPNGGYLTV